MQVITITSEAYTQLINKIEDIHQKLDAEVKNNPLHDTWLDIQEVCQLLKISKRTLQYYRDNGTLSFSQVQGKIYFKASDIQKHLEKHYHPALK